MLRKFIKIGLSKSRILRPLKNLHQNKIIIFNYHRIKDRRRSKFLFDEGVIGPDPNRFLAEITWLKKETKILCEDELLEIIYCNKKIKGPCSMITFDDGYRDNFDLAFPLLKKQNIPALFFIPTYHLTERKVGWWDVTAYLLKKYNQLYNGKPFTFNDKLYSASNLKLLTREFNTTIKSMESSKVNSYLENLSATLNIPLPDEELQGQELMSCEQIKLMKDQGMGIGSHSHDHSILSKQDANTLTAQLAKSMHVLESILGKNINSIAYPVGGYEHFNELTKAVSKNVGFKLGFSFLTGFNQYDQLDPFNVKRVYFRPEWENLDIPLAFPQLFLNKTNH